VEGWRPVLLVPLSIRADLSGALGMKLRPRAVVMSQVGGRTPSPRPTAAAAASSTPYLVPQCRKTWLVWSPGPHQLPVHLLTPALPALQGPAGGQRRAGRCPLPPGRHNNMRHRRQKKLKMWEQGCSRLASCLVLARQSRLGGCHTQWRVWVGRQAPRRATNTNIDTRVNTP
jgi:hypothetical protein